MLQFDEIKSVIPEAEIVFVNDGSKIFEEKKLTKRRKIKNTECCFGFIKMVIIIFLFANALPWHRGPHKIVLRISESRALSKTDTPALSIFFQANRQAYNVYRVVRNLHTQ